MRYISTRGEAPDLNFSDVLLTGLADDGGLYVPAEWPVFDQKTIAQMAGQPYEAIAFAVLHAYIGADSGIGDTPLRRMIDEAYSGFTHVVRTPLVQIAPNRFILELFHGPTLAFKDLAMQILARLMDHVLTARGERVTIVGATSGDTGAAAIEAFRNMSAVDVVILHPLDRVSPVQRRQMTTVDADNIHNIALEGTFDDCQRALKAMFNNRSFREHVRLAGVNSINWVRIAAQIVYYFVAGTALGAPHRAINFVVPSGNFGDIFAGYCAKRMGLPVNHLVAATNENDILARTIHTGRHEPEPVVATTSPSMDIQIASNFERALFEAHERDAQHIVRLMASQAQSGAFTMGEGPLRAIQADFGAVRVNAARVHETIKRTYQSSGYRLDPHTAVAVAADHGLDDESDVHHDPHVVLATAHAAKFPQAVNEALGFELSMPPKLAAVLRKPERFDIMGDDQEALQAYVVARSRAAGTG